MMGDFRHWRVPRATKADQAISRVQSRRATIVTQHPAKTFVADDFTLGATDFFARIDDSVLQPLVISRRMCHGAPKTGQLGARENRPVMRDSGLSVTLEHFDAGDRRWRIDSAWPKSTQFSRYIKRGTPIGGSPNCWACIEKRSPDTSLGGRFKTGQTRPPGRKALRGKAGQRRPPGPSRTKGRFQERG